MTAMMMGAGFIALKLLGLDTFEPLAIIKVIQYHLWLEAVIALTVVSLPVLIIAGRQKGGFVRVLTYYLLASLTLILASLAVGFLLFLLIKEEAILSVWQISRYLEALFLDSASFNQFLTLEAISLLFFSAIAGYLLYEAYGSKSNALGDAHFANGLEVKQSGFFNRVDESIIIGKKYGVPLYSNGFEHVLVFAPPGSGKTRSIGMPNLFHCRHSVVCNDVKLTLFKTTSGYREKILGHRCYCWAPASSDLKTHRFNPLSLISDDKINRIMEIQRIAHILMPTPKQEAAIWSQASRKLFKALVLYMLDNPDTTPTLGGINRLIKQAGFDEWLGNILEQTEHYDPEFYRNGYSYLNNHYKTRSSILETFSGYFELFDDPIIDAATSATDFDITQLRKDKITIYIGFSDDDMERLSPLLTLFWQQTLSTLIQKIPDLNDEPYPVLCLIDEFSSLGRIERLRRSLKLLREYRVRCVLMFQYIAQTYEQYSHDEARAFTNIKTKIAYAADDINDAEFISKLIGTRTKKVRAGSYSQQTRGMSNSKSYNYQAIPLLRPEKVMKLPDHVSLILRTGSYPVKAQQYIWYKEPAMKNLKLVETFIPKQQANITPFDHQAKKESSKKSNQEKNTQTSEEGALDVSDL